MNVEECDGMKRMIQTNGNRGICVNVDSYQATLAAAQQKFTGLVCIYDNFALNDVPQSL